MFESMAAHEQRRMIYEKGRDVQDELQAAFSDPMLRLAERAGNFAADHESALQQAASFHPISEIPFTALPPDLPQPLPSSSEAVPPYLAAYWWEHEQTQQAYAGIRDREILSRKELIPNLRQELVAIAEGTQPMPPFWEEYVQGYQAEQRRDFVTLPAFAAEYSRRRYAELTPFVTLEREIIEEHLTYRYPSGLTFNTSAQHSFGTLIRAPLSPEANSIEVEKRLRAAAFIIDFATQDEAFYAAIAKAVEAHPEVVELYTLRAQDEPHDLLGSPIFGYLESVSRAVLPLLAELERGQDTADHITGALAAKVTQLVSLGYVGPVGLQGVGMTEPIIAPDGIISEKARTDFASIQERWTPFHLEERRRYEEALERGEAVKPPTRTGRPCVFAKAYRTPEGELLPGVIAASTDLVLNVAARLDERKPPVFTRENPYRPWNVQTIIRGALGSQAVSHLL